MPIDPSIPLQARAPQSESMLSTLGSILSMQAQAQQMQANRLKLQQAQREEEENTLLRGIVEKHRADAKGGPVDWDVIVEELSPFAPDKAITIKGLLAKQRKEAADAESVVLGNASTRLSQGLKLLGAVKDQDSFDRILPVLRRTIQNDPLVDQLGKEYDPKIIEDARTWGMDEAARLTAQREAIRLLNDTRNIDLTAARDEVTRTEAQSRILENYTKATSKVLSAARTPDDWELGIKSLRAQGVPAAIVSQFGEWEGPQSAKRAAEFGMTPKEREEVRIAQGNLDVNRGQLAEQGRHNRTTEKLALDQFKMAQARWATDPSNPENVAKVADMALTNPDLLKELTASERGRLISHIANSDDPTYPNRLAQSRLTMLKNTLQTLGELDPDKADGFAGAVGQGGPASLFGFLGDDEGPSPRSGSSAAGYKAKFNTLKAQLTLPKLDMLRGLGPASDRDVKILGEAATALSRSASEKQYKAEYKRLIESTRNLYKLIAAEAGVDDAADTYTDRRPQVKPGFTLMSTPRGNRWIPDAEVDAALAAGAKKVGG